MPSVYAAADIGSNTAHLLVAAAGGGLVTRIDNYNEWIPLGETVAKEGQIPKEMVAQLVQAVKEFRRVAEAKRAEKLYIFATEGMRMARNHEAVLKKIRDEAGVVVDLIPPSREAALSYLGVGLDTRHLGADVLLEVGGGSLQIGRVENDVLGRSESLPLGTGRIIAESGLLSPPNDRALRAARKYVSTVLDRATLLQPAELPVASGGVVRGLWRALHPDGDKTLRLEELDYLAWSTARLPLDRIVVRFSVKPKRAGTLLPGAIVYSEIMRRLGVEEIVVSEFGIREGAILEMAGGA